MSRRSQLLSVFALTLAISVVTGACSDSGSSNVAGAGAGAGGAAGDSSGGTAGDNSGGTAAGSAGTSGTATGGSAAQCGARGVFCNSATPCCNPLVCNRSESQTCSCGDDMGTAGTGTTSCDSGSGGAGTSGAGGAGGCRAQGQACLVPDAPCCAPLKCTSDGFTLTCNP